MSNNELLELMCIWGLVFPCALAVWGVLFWMLGECIGTLKEKRERRKRDEEWAKKWESK